MRSSQRQPRACPSDRGSSRSETLPSAEGVAARANPRNPPGNAHDLPGLQGRGMHCLHSEERPAPKTEGVKGGREEAPLRMSFVRVRARQVSPVTVSRVLGRDFVLPERYHVVDSVGQGAFGLVVSARDAVLEDMVAIKKIERIFDSPTFTKRTLRELRFLRMLKHDNLVGMWDMIVPSDLEGFKELCAARRGGPTRSRDGCTLFAPRTGPQARGSRAHGVGPSYRHQIPAAAL